MDSYTIEYFSGSEVIGVSFFSSSLGELRWHYQKSNANKNPLESVVVVIIFSFILSISLFYSHLAQASTFNDVWIM